MTSIPMKKKNSRVVRPSILEETEQEQEIERLLEPDPTAVEDSEKLSEFLDQFGGKEYKVRVDQYNGVDKVWEYMDTFPIDGFDAFDTCKKWGRGRYRMTFLNENGKYVKGGQPQIRIGGVAANALPVAAVVPEKEDPLKHPMVAMMIENLRASNAQTTELLKAFFLRPVEPQKVPTTSELIESLAKLKTLEPKGDGDAFGKFKQFLELQVLMKEASGDNDGNERGEGFMQDLKDGLSAAKEMGLLNPRRGAPLQAARPQAPKPVQVTLPQAPPELREPPTASANPVLEGLRPYIAIFKNKAEAQTPITEASGFLVDELYSAIVPLIKKHVPGASWVSDETIVENLINRAGDPSQLEGVFKFAPELVEHKEWVLSVIAEAIKDITLGDQPEATA